MWPGFHRQKRTLTFVGNDHSRVITAGPLTAKERLSTPELRELLANGEVRIGRFISTVRGEARVELIDDQGQAAMVLVADPA